MKKKIVILGSTGSIGKQTLDVVDASGDFEVIGLSAHSNIEILIEQIKKYNIKKAAVTSEKAYDEIKNISLDCKILFGKEGLTELASMEEADIVVNSLVGSVGLVPTLAAIKNKKTIALANKETLVTAGELVMKSAKENSVNIYPIDSEHSAIFQCLQGSKRSELNKIYLTASGGAFREYTKEMLKNIKLEDALKHPNWVMGAKITIDSSTLMNKGLEVIEAKYLFNLDLDEIEVLIHPQSIIHSMVEFKDGAIIAQLGRPDMRVPISYALNYPKRIDLPYEKLNFFENPELKFERPNYENFPCLSLAFEALKIGRGMPCVMNMANETAVALFMERKISFLDIPLLIEKAMSAYNVKNIDSLDDVLNTEDWTREFIFNSLR